MPNYRILLRGFALFTIIAAMTAAGFAAFQPQRGGLPGSLRLYVFDCGTLHFTNADSYRLKPEEVANTNMSMTCYLITHPRGALLWDSGAIPDADWKPTGSPVKMHIVLPDKQERDVTMVKPLMAQLAEAGVSPSNITYLAVSHYHWDHIGNANAFAGSTWLARKADRDIMFSDPPPDRTVPKNYSQLRNSKTLIIDKDEYDVFGDGTVILKSAPGHTPGHQVLFLKLPKTGPVVLSGDLYHYPEERTLNRLPTRDFDEKLTAASRAEIEVFLKKTGAQFWIEHDITAAASLRKSPAYYD